MSQIQERHTLVLKFLFVISVAVLFFALLSPIHAKAAEPVSWTALGNGVYQLDGTEVKAEVSPGKVHITGSGALPDFDYWKLNKRPWATCECQSVTIDDTITSIGAYVFYDLPKLKYISISSKTFIKNDTSFYKISSNPIFRVYGADVSTVMIGTIPYTSRDSLLAVSQSAGTGRAYVFDNSSLASAFQGMTNPTIQNVYSATDSRAPWNDLVTYWNGNIYTPICRITGPTAAPYIVTATRSYQGLEAYKAFAAYIGTNTFATTFNITVTANDANKTIVSKTNGAYQYTLTIPETFRKSGRVFQLLGIGQNGVVTYSDLDADGKTITFTTENPTASYALVFSGN